MIFFIGIRLLSLKQRAYYTYFSLKIKAFSKEMKIFFIRLGIITDK